ncbi:MAG: aminopeptidase P family protein, partial [Lachnospiraceae bacterium]|nr:aminopeptidase P family protein [Lachnospiraceae bacterium]
EALLWTDGRYFIQAERELKDTGITLMRAGEDGVDTVEEYLKKNMSSEAVLGFDGRTVSVSKAESLKEAMPSKKISYKKDLSNGIFIRPEFPETEAKTLDDALTGESSSKKLTRLREELKKDGCDAIFISKPEETAWLFNVRANDIKHTPVALAYSYITEDRAYLFINNGESLESSDDVIIRAYDEVGGFLKKENKACKVMIDKDSINYRCFKLLKKNSSIVFKESPVEQMKAVKNKTELSHIRDIYHKDSLQLTRFIKWLTEFNGELTETKAADKLLSFRKEIPGFNDISFTTIAAYGENAAVIHYEPSLGNAKVVEKKGLFMVDSGGQYDGGTTDVTRTVVMGDLTKEEKEAFTLVALGMLRLKNTRFLKGSTGQNLDILARERLWQKGMDYKHGTGHGIGYMLSVHEGPQCIRMKAINKNAALKPGMLVSDEPGIYREGKFGVRTENILLVEEDMKTSDGEFFKFKNLTEVPIDDKGMDRSLMSREDLEMYIDYQKEVCESLSPDLTAEERAWLYRYAGIAE